MATVYATRGMSCMNAVDTNVYVYALDAYEPAKHTLYSEDMAAGMNYDGVAIANPFA
jgi:predicted nucleic acid-binding protein